MPMQSWYKREDEPEKAYAAFETYLRMPKPRRKQTIADERIGHINSVNKWAREYEWDERVRDYDNWISESRDTATALSMAGTQKKITETGIEDSFALREIYLSLLNKAKEDITLSDLRVFLQVRRGIDDLARASAMMPKTHKASPEFEEVQHIVLGGNPTFYEDNGSDEDNLSASPQVSEDST